MRMGISVFKRIITFTVVLTLAFQPLKGSRGQSLAGNLAPCPVSSESPPTVENEAFSGAVRFDAGLIHFSMFIYKKILEEGKDLKGLLDEVRDLPFWNNIKSYLAVNFVSVEGDILIIKFASGDRLRILPLGPHKVDLSSGAIEDRIVPEFFDCTDKFAVQYLGSSSLSGGEKIPDTDLSGVKNVYKRIWEKARPYYEKGRPHDVRHIEWMMKEASRIAES